MNLTTKILRNCSNIFQESWKNCLSRLSTNPIPARESQKVTSNRIVIVEPQILFSSRHTANLPKHLQPGESWTETTKKGLRISKT